MSDPRPFLFDIGNVICSVDFDPMLALFRSQSDSGNRLDGLAAVKDEYEAGGMGDTEFIEQVSSAIGFRGDRADFVAIWNGIFQENAPVSRLVESLAGSGHPLYLLSNTNAMHLEHLLAEYPVFRHFAGGVYSHEAGAIKPDRRIYEIAIEKFRLRPEQTIYIDDLAVNIEAGGRLGLVSYCYAANRHADLIDWLANQGMGRRANG